MKLMALLTTLLLGSSSVAMARPAYHPTPAPAPSKAPVVRDHRAPIYHPAPIYRPAPRPAPRPAWVMLGQVDRATSGATSFQVGRSHKSFTTVKLQRTAGKSLVRRVQIQFANGRTQTVDLNQYLTASNPSITIDLAGHTRSIAKVTVIGRNARHAAYRVLAI